MEIQLGEGLLFVLLAFGLVFALMLRHAMIQRAEQETQYVRKLLYDDMDLKPDFVISNIVNWMASNMTNATEHSDRGLYWDFGELKLQVVTIASRILTVEAIHNGNIVVQFALTVGPNPGDFSNGSEIIKTGMLCNMGIKQFNELTRPERLRALAPISNR
jgi:hypothetical protein